MQPDIQPEGRDVALLWDMREAARDIQDMTHGISLELFAADRMRRLAVERQMTVIGEAARRTSPGLKDAHPEIPWNSIVALRNLITHEYEKVRVERIWQIAVEDVPELVALLDPLVPAPPED